ncbi:hypothetical protein [Thiobacillus denitrificans]|uniref:hypothetical protein n=1 Tax=Thiobacillus denitrificans TaxID=36861 RepID=UPI00039E201C|nr:hypothetical protein [Thiobacillus denitrificans]
MPADFSTLIDTLLVLAGLVLVATGLVMFIYSKTSTQASSVEAFGIKLNVTHPSLILVLAGVGLMLAPRLLPGLPGKEDGKPVPAVVAEAPPMGASPGTTAVPVQPPPSVPASPPAAAPAVPLAIPGPRIPAATVPPASATARSAVTPSSAPVQPAPAAKPRAVAPETATKTPAPRVATARPAAAPTATIRPEAAAPPPAAARPERPLLAFAALGLPINRSFWAGETRASYTQRVNVALQQAGRDVLRMDARGLELGQTEFNAWWNESGQHPRSRELCDGSQAPLALLSARVESPTSISSVESAYWPELKMRLYVCANQRLYRQQKTLSPQNDDAWPFANELNSEIERFLRTYRGDLTE